MCSVHSVCVSALCSVLSRLVCTVHLHTATDHRRGEIAQAANPDWQTSISPLHKWTTGGEILNFKVKEVEGYISLVATLVRLTLCHPKCKYEIAEKFDLIRCVLA